MPPDPSGLLSKQVTRCYSCSETAASNALFVRTDWEGRQREVDCQGRADRLPREQDGESTVESGARRGGGKASPWGCSEWDWITGEER